ncbi:hypothetical protein [uncultured Algoriphagus sp.]|uniref:hypothetical protein n=1 Tax=uncultured Algoriphagus sp. TaxID=417365 RepID=UPI0030EE0A99|tara:strand:+ start:4576 stop:5820 length:1245 start_codon:yes stop_codon:yes gene_type:complete
MRTEILTHIDDPAYLEKLYRINKSSFKESFTLLYPEIEDKPQSKFWLERLNYESNSISWGSKNELLFVFIGCFIAGIIAKFPVLFSIPEDFFYPRNIGFILFPILVAYFSWRNKLSRNFNSLLFGIIGIGLVYINALPDSQESDSIILACIHLPLLLWVIVGSAYSGKDKFKIAISLDFLRFNGDALVMIAVLGIAGGILTGVTFGLFSLIGVPIEIFFQNYILVFGLPAIPILATFLTQNNSQLVNKVSPVIAKLFSPAVLVMLFVYIMAIIYTGKDPYNDREFLLIFNLLLVGVMALIFFSVAEKKNAEKITFDIWILFFLSILTIIVNGIALSAITFRISEWGLTPNRMAVLGANILILINLLLVTFNLFKSLKSKVELPKVGKAIVSYIPVYFVWALIVVFFFPLIFNFQ